MNYQRFLASKAPITIFDGFPTQPADLGSHLSGFQQALVAWALTKGRAALFADTGLGKTRMQLTWAHHIAQKTGKRVLILAPLAVAPQTVQEGQRCGISVNYCRYIEQLRDGINITNYEMLSRFNPADFVGVVLDESSILKSYSGAMRNQIIESFQRTPYRLSCTATPAPNDFMELGNQAEFLGVMTRVEMLAQFFVHDGGETSVWRLKGHAESEFWKWVSSWAVAVKRPSDIGFEDTGYHLPTLHIKHHRIDIERETAGMLFAMPAATLNDQRKAKRDTLQDRCQTIADLVAREPNESWLIWCELNDEGDQLEKLIPGAVQVQGSDTPEHKEKTMLGFADGSVKILITKPSIAGFGMNWQQCARMAFASITHSYEQFYQAVRRSWRFGQTREVQVHVVFSDAEQLIVDNLQRKEMDAQRMTESMVQHMFFENNGLALGRDRDLYNPNQTLRIPHWLQGESA